MANDTILNFSEYDHANALFWITNGLQKQKGVETAASERKALAKPGEVLSPETSTYRITCPNPTCQYGRPWTAEQAQSAFNKIHEGDNKGLSGWCQQFLHKKARGKLLNHVSAKKANPVDGHLPTITISRATYTKLTEIADKYTMTKVFALDMMINQYIEDYE